MIMDKNTKIVLTVIGGGLTVLLLLMIVFVAYIGSSTDGNPFGDTVAVIPLQGEIGYASSSVLSSDVVTPETFDDEISQAEDDPTVSAILVEVNSPGGTPVASEEIMESINDSKKPVVVWISDVGASGAYLASTSADKIVASPSSMVGSIGVIMDMTDLSGLYQKLGINKYSIKAGEYKDMGADYRNLTSEERSMLQSMVDQDYAHFISIVATNRHLNATYVESVAGGKIYTGTQAKDLKLVDDTGSKEHALDLAAKLGGIDGEYNIVTITPPTSFEDMLSSVSSSLAYSLGKGIGSNLKEGSIEYIFQ
jgi:protease-4